MVAGLIVSWLLSDEVLSQFYAHPEHARPLVVITSGLIGFAIGGMVLAAFRRFELARQDIAYQAEGARDIADLTALPAQEHLDPAAASRGAIAAENYGAYSRMSVAHLEGRYLCLRPAFTKVGVISAYLIELAWDEAASCLAFEERGRADAGHTQRGLVYVPDGRPFINFVTVERGAIRLVTVSRPDQGQSGRGLILTLANPDGMHFTPAAAPIVLRRIVDEMPKLGFIQSDDPDYELYREELELVAPAFGQFASAPRAATAESRQYVEMS